MKGREYSTVTELPGRINLKRLTWLFYMNIYLTRLTGKTWSCTLP